jgi:uncharacterized protein (DUF169 family)
MLRQLEQQFVDALSLDLAPVAVTFCEHLPQGIPRFQGTVPAGCRFWKLAATRPAGRSAFYTVPADHHNCPVGSYTHNIDLGAARAHELGSVLTLFAQIGYVKPEEVPHIPRWETAPTAIVYSRLADAAATPDVVVFALPPSAAMRLNEAALACGVAAGVEPLSRPTCMAIPLASGKGATMSFGCVGNRVYTELPDSHVYMMVRGKDLGPLATSLVTIIEANAQLDAYHRGRKQSLTDEPATQDGPAS